MTFGRIVGFALQQKSKRNNRKKFEGLEETGDAK